MTTRLNAQLQKPRRRALRKQMTPAEAFLWTFKQLGERFPGSTAWTTMYWISIAPSIDWLSSWMGQGISHRKERNTINGERHIW